MLVVGSVSGKEIIQLLVGAAAVIVIGVNNGERPINHVLAAKHRMAGTPGLDPPLRHHIALRQHLQLLIDVLYIEILLHPLTDEVLEVFLNFMLDDKGYLPKPCPVSVVQGKVNDGVAVVVHRGDLLQAAKAAAHTRRQNNESGFLHDTSLQNILWCPYYNKRSKICIEKKYFISSNFVLDTDDFTQKDRKKEEQRMLFLLAYILYFSANWA